MTIEKRLEKKINTMIQITGSYPEEIEITEKEYKELQEKENDKFRGVKLKIKKKQYH